MQTVLYDGSFEGWLCAVFDVFDYKFEAVDLCRRDRFQGTIFGAVHEARFLEAHAQRVWRGLQRKLSAEGLQAVSQCFLADEAGIANTLLRYVSYVFASEGSVEQDFSHPDVLAVSQVARKVWKEQHRMEAFVRFQKTADGLYYALIEPDHDVLPLIAKHFTTRYADQRWLIYDGRRRYGIHYDGARTHAVEIQFSEAAAGGREVAAVYDPEEAFYQQLWRQYFKSVNIAARKNTRLQVQHMPRRYWKYLVEKQPGSTRY
ncbi:DNA metabolism protein [Flaviaesturariibacter flavus]|uniref:DNA metabolism protein n=1 Tax=Flaviaesturariibacter flavus TaxID=2502780 RepID=A0A4R1BKH8_9BACT|nr:DNA metabolism protein [Flaviaesturariibacter flavus]